MKMFNKTTNKISLLNFLSVILMIAVIYSCEEVVDFEVEDIDQNIVIEGSITNTNSNNFVKLSYSENAFKNFPAQNVRGAKVTLSDNDHNSEVLNETSAGIFPISSISGVYGKNYYLKVEYGGNVYSGFSKLLEPMKFD